MTPIDPFFLPAPFSPLGCFLSSKALLRLPAELQRLVQDLNNARILGRPTLLEAHEKQLEDLIATGATTPEHDGHIPEGLIARAAWGNALSVLGRWRGNKDQLERGSKLLKEFIGLAAPLKFGDNQETRARAHLIYGTSLVRLGYYLQSPSVLQESVHELESETFPVKSIQSQALHAAIHRDLGDAYTGQLHWDPDVVVGGESVDRLRAAAQIFVAIICSDAGSCMIDELAVTESVLAVALACIADRLDEGAPVTKKFLGGDSRSEAASRSRAEARALCLRIWKSYIDLVNSRATLLPNQKLRPFEQVRFIPFRWARTVSNIAFAASYLYRADPTDFEIARISEGGFRSVIPVDSRNIDGFMFMGPREQEEWAGAFTHGAFYSWDDHRHRYERNYDGYSDLARMLE